MKVPDAALSAPPPATAPAREPAFTPAPIERVSNSSSQQVTATFAQVRAQLPADRAARVEQVTQAVSQGHYEPNPQRIAECIVEAAELDAKLSLLLRK